MSFREKHIRSLGASNLMDDEFHHQTEALQASGFADKMARNIGSLLSRVKYHDGPLADQLANITPNLTQLSAEWLAIVTEKGKARKWVKIERVEDISVAVILYRNVATYSLHHYLDGACDICGGRGSLPDARLLLSNCGTCKGTGRGKLPPMRPYEAKLVGEMIAELEALESSHAGYASKLMRREG